MKNYMVIARINGVDYLSKVEAESEMSAEHKILDAGICGKHEYGVESCMAYDYDMMSTETFRAHALNAEPISLDVLKVKIEVRNAEIRQRDYAEKRITEIEKKIEQLKAELEENKKSEVIQMKTNNAVDVCLASGVTIKYAGIIEIYPRKATNSFVLDAALHILSQTHEIVRMTDNWLRAFEKRA